MNKWKRFFAAATAGACLLSGAHAELDAVDTLWLEQSLGALGYFKDEADIEFDNDTRAALRSFQSANGLGVTGEADAATIALLKGGTAVSSSDYLISLADEYALMTPLTYDSVGDSVVWLQQALKELGYFRDACDGVFGAATEAAVRRFQVANGLRETGVADGSLHMRLREGTALRWADFVTDVSSAPGEEGAHVRILQKRLRLLGYYSGSESGLYGEYTRDAVARFQTDNALPATGTADADTVTAMFYGDAVAQRSDATLERGDSGEDVAALQQRLSELGYFDRNVTGNYGATTETAVRLFQMASGLPFTGEADAETRTRLDAEDAASLSAVRETFAAQVRNQDATAFGAIGSIALGLLGQPFEADDEDLFEGFAFVQYACVAAGIPVISPEDIVSEIETPISNAKEPQLGELLSFRQEGAEGDTLLLAVSSGDGRAIYVLPESGWVVQSPIALIGEGECLRWVVEDTAE